MLVYWLKCMLQVLCLLQCCVTFGICRSKCSIIFRSCWSPARAFVAIDKATNEVQYLAGWLVYASDIGPHSLCACGTRLHHSTTISMDGHRRLSHVCTLADNWSFFTFCVLIVSHLVLSVLP